jgi:hypothetical protein
MGQGNLLLWAGGRRLLPLDTLNAPNLPHVSTSLPVCQPASLLSVLLSLFLAEHGTPAQGLGCWWRRKKR